MKRNECNSELKIAVVVGYHTFQVCQFQEMFETFPGMHFYIQHLEQFTSSSEEVRRSYDVVVFYTMQHQTPVNDGPWYEGEALTAMSQVGDHGQGIVVLHHTLLAFENWPVWKEITGLDPDTYRDYRLDVPMQYHVKAIDHPIMAGIQDFAMTDEAYLCDSVEGIEGLEVLLTTDHPENISSVAWTNHYKDARVFCYQSGHDHMAYNHESFRRILYQGILWAARQI